MKFESKIAAFLDTHLLGLFAWDAATKHLIGSKCYGNTEFNACVQL